jgi:hypothetical protein
MNRIAIPFVLAASLLAAPVGAQGKGRNRDAVPTGYRPPAGMCRVWIDGVPPGQQPGPTDCATAVRDRPANSRVIFGDDANVAKGKQLGRYMTGKYRPDASDDTDDSRNRDDDDDTDDRDRRRRSGDICVDRDRDGRCDARRGSDICVDSDRDGQCDDRRGSDICMDRNRDGRCDDPVSGRRTPSLPEMIGSILIGQGRRSADVERWLGVDAVSARYQDADRDGKPERATWVNRAGQIVQIWIDSNRDGRADTVRLYRDGRIVKVIE